MKKTTLILSLILSGVLAKAQFGVSAELGRSFISGFTQVNGIEYQPKLYYSYGVFYQLYFGESKWGLYNAINFNKRGYGYLKTSNNYFTDFQNISHSYEVQVDYTVKSIALAVSPTFSITSKLQCAVGPHFTVVLGTKRQESRKDYETDGGGNKQLTRTYEEEQENSSDIIFGDRVSYGVKAFLTYQFVNFMNVGVGYQYSRQYEYYKNINKPFYNIFNITANIYFVKPIKNNANKN